MSSDAAAAPALLSRSYQSAAVLARVRGPWSVLVRLSLSRWLTRSSVFIQRKLEVGRGDGRGRGSRRRRRRRRFGRRRNFLFAFFCPIGCRRRRHWPPNPAPLAGFWPGWSSFSSSTLSESNTPMPTVRRRGGGGGGSGWGHSQVRWGNVVGNGNAKGKGKGRKEVESEWRKSRAAKGREEKRR